MLRILVGIETNPHWEPLNDFDKVAAGIFRWQKAEQGSGGAREILDRPSVVATERINMNVHRLTRTHVLELGFFEVRGHSVKDHVWHMETLAGICKADPDLLLATPFRTVDLTEPSDKEKGIQWSEELTASGGEGMVVKPFDFVAKGRKGLAQPAVKVR